MFILNVYIYICSQKSKGSFLLFKKDLKSAAVLQSEKNNNNNNNNN